MAKDGGTDHFTSRDSSDDLCFLNGIDVTLFYVYFHVSSGQWRKLHQPRQKSELEAEGKHHHPNEVKEAGQALVAGKKEGEGSTSNNRGKCIHQTEAQRSDGKATPPNE